MKIEEISTKAEELAKWVESALESIKNHPRFFEDIETRGLQLGLLFLKEKLVPEIRSGLNLPIVVMLCGGTNSGKSTVANSLAGRVVSPTGGGIASYTKRNIIIGDAAKIRKCVSFHPAWRLRNMDELQAMDDVIPAVFEGHVSDYPSELPIIIDTPDIDSSDTICRKHSASVVGLADLIVWLTTQQKYKDRAGMTFLDDAMALLGRRIDVFNQFLPRHSDAFEDLQKFYSERWNDVISIPIKVPEHPNLPEDGLLDQEALMPLKKELQAAEKERVRLKIHNLSHSFKHAGKVLIENAKALAVRQEDCYRLKKEILDFFETALFGPLRELRGNEFPFELQSSLVRVIGPKVQTSVGMMVNRLNQSASKALRWAYGLFNPQNADQKIAVDPIAQRDRQDLLNAVKILDSCRYELLEKSRFRSSSGHPLHVRFHHDLKKIDFLSYEELLEKLKKKLEEDTKTKLLPLVSHFEEELEKFCGENPALIAALQTAVPGFSALVALGAAAFSIHTFAMLPGAAEYLMGGIALPIFSKLEKILPERLLSLADEMSHQPFISEARENFIKTRSAIFLEAGCWLTKPVEDLLSFSNFQDFDVESVLRDMQNELEKYSMTILDNSKAGEGKAFQVEKGAE